MNNPFEHSSSTWVRYNAYEWKTDKNGVLYISPADDGVPEELCRALRLAVHAFQGLGVHGLTTFLYYEDRDSLEDAQTGVYHKAMASFDGNAPSYHIELHDQPVLVWDFHLLLLGIQMMLAFALTDESKPLHLCRHCMKPFFAKRKDSIYCNPKCRNLAKSGEDK